MRHPGSYYCWSDTGNGSGHLCPQCVPVLQEQSVSITVRPRGKWPPAQPQSASKTPLITSTYRLHLAKPTAGRGFPCQAEGKMQRSSFYNNHLTWHINCLHTQQHHEPERNMASVLLPLWAGRDGASIRASHIRKTHTHCARGLTPRHRSPAPALFVPSNCEMRYIYIFYPCNWFCQPEIVSNFCKLAVSEIWIF